MNNSYLKDTFLTFFFISKKEHFVYSVHKSFLENNIKSLIISKYLLGKTFFVVNNIKLEVMVNNKKIKVNKEFLN